MTNDNQITDRVVDTAQRIEDTDDPDEIDPLDVEVACDLQGRIKEVVLTLTVGGPYIELNVTKGTVYGHWGGESHTTHVNNEALCGILERQYTDIFKANS